MRGFITDYGSTILLSVVEGIGHIVIDAEGTEVYLSPSDARFMAQSLLDLVPEARIIQAQKTKTESTSPAASQLAATGSQEAE